MRKIKLELKCRVPSWNYCNLDDFTDDPLYSKETCRFCVTTKKGRYCSLHDEWLSAGPHFVNKTTKCIDATAGCAIGIDEHAAMPIDPKTVIRETINGYSSLVTDLMKQGYPRNLAEMLAKKHMIGD